MGTEAAPSQSSASIASAPGTLLGKTGRLAFWRWSGSAQTVLAVTLLGAALRFATLNVQSIWLDESATILLVHRSFSGMLSHLSASESAPPLYYVVAWIWTRIFGGGAIGFRSLSAVIGTITIPVLYAAGRQISPRVGLWAAALAAANPAMYYYSQEARCYAMLILFSAAAFVFWQRAMDTEDRRALTFWAGASILALLTHYFAAFLFVPETVLLVRRIGLKRARVALGAVALVGIALLPLAASQRASGKTNWIEDASLASRLAETVKQFFVGLNGPAQIFTTLIVGLLASAAMLSLLTREQPGTQRRAREAAIVAFVGVALPLALALSHAVDVFDGRNVIAAWVPSAMFVAAGLGGARSGRGGILLGAGICLVSVAVILATNVIPAYQRDDWRGAAQQLPQLRAPRVILAESTALLPLSIYLGPLHTLRASSISVSEVDFITLRIKRSNGSPLRPVVPIAPPPGFRLAAISEDEAYAVSRFVSPQPVSVRVGLLRNMLGKPSPEAIIQR